MSFYNNINTINEIIKQYIEKYHNLPFLTILESHLYEIRVNIKLNINPKE